ncbi:hypothetical protein [Modestobacter excelsi]|uniref:hypothetical protein n=1 Tax=Modestobacter excelsi TaxID=2213161 RepID=UPI001C20F3B4|nr:hypothetical protein [Modestobacter excelsi]
MDPCPGRRARTPPRPAVVLASNGAYDGPTTLTASAAPTFDGVAAMAPELTGRTIARVVAGEDEWVAAQVAAGRPEFVARFLPGMYQAAARWSSADRVPGRDARP